MMLMAWFERDRKRANCESTWLGFGCRRVRPSVSPEHGKGQIEKTPAATRRDGRTSSMRL